jgi:hypothetical protein
MRRSHKKNFDHVASELVLGRNWHYFNLIKIRIKERTLLFTQIIQRNNNFKINIGLYIAIDLSGICYISRRNVQIFKSETHGVNLKEFFRLVKDCDSLSKLSDTYPYQCSRDTIQRAERTEWRSNSPVFLSALCSSCHRLGMRDTSEFCPTAKWAGSQNSPTPPPLN